MSRRLGLTVFLMFVISGFCSLVYQTVWIRLAFSHFGIVTHVLSVIISIFMLGLFLGSWWGGRLIAWLTRRAKVSAVVFYALAELLIGLGAFAVPRLFAAGELVLLNLGETNSFLYLIFSAAVIALAILPWCVAMGTTYPFMIAFLKERRPGTSDNFSFLYLANVIGATAGTLLTVFIFIETFGFSQTLVIAGLLNFLIATLGFSLRGEGAEPAQIPGAAAVPDAPGGKAAAGISVAAILFMTGFTSLAMEVVWTRAFTPILGTMVYAFSALLLFYFVATWGGSFIYRRGRASGRIAPVGTLLVVLTVVALLPLLFNDPRILQLLGRPDEFMKFVFVAGLSIVPFSLLLGYLTPCLVDRYVKNDPDAIGRNYGYNILGCILGPLAASYLLLPFLGVKYSLIILAVPYAVFAFLYVRTRAARAGTIVSLGMIAACAAFSVTIEVPRSSSYVLKRDHTATVLCMGEGMGKRLLVNGVGITCLTPITKYMAHLPLAFHKEKPRSALVICFGMGTTFRSLLSWDVDATAVELVPSVRDVFGYFHEDAAEVVRNPLGRIVIDDGRRYLMRTARKFDVITIDPPPPIEASGSSLLYSEEFYRVLKRRLNPGGILQQWFPYSPATEEEKILKAMARSIANSFPYVRVFRSIDGWGAHFIASESPISDPTAEELAARFPEKARRDILEWGPGADLVKNLKSVLSVEIPLQVLLDEGPSVRITDDRPYNEFFLIRRRFSSKKHL